MMKLNPKAIAATTAIFRCRIAMIKVSVARMKQGCATILKRFRQKGEPMITKEEVFDVLMEIQKHLIKCKDCKWCEKSGGILWCNIWHNDTNGLNFCSYAERRADEHID